MSTTVLPLTDPDTAAHNTGEASSKPVPVTAEMLMRLPVRDRRFVVDEATHRIHDATGDPGLQPWAGISAALEFFDQAGWGQPVAHAGDRGDFISVTDAYVLEALARGVAMALDDETDDHGNPGAAVWRDYILRLTQNPEWPRTHRGEHDRLWARAEHLATEHGRHQAEHRGARRTEAQYRWYLLSAMYRSLMCEPPRLMHRLGLAGPLAWLSTVTRPTPVAAAARLAHAFAEANPLGLASGGVRVGLAYVGDLLT